MASAFAAPTRPSRDSSLAMTALRELLGPDPREGDLLELLQRSNMDVNAAADTYFLGGHAEGVPVARPVSKPQATVAAPPPPPPLDLFQVQCPAGKYAGDEITVSTPSGRRCRVTVPNGVAPGTTFLVRLPADGASSIANGASSSRLSNVVYVRQPPQVVHVVDSPYGPYGGYYHRTSGGYPYAYGSFGRYYGPRYGYDPVVGMGVGFLGGMLVADALFW
jgi:hypothetical protein